MRKLTAVFIIFLVTKTASAQNQSNNGTISGGYESFSEWYQNDPKTGVIFDPSQARFRSNNYFKVDYLLNHFKAGVQYEAYLPAPLLGYSPKLEGTSISGIPVGNNGIATYYGNFTIDQLDITAGYFYEQFGNGLIFRTWEDRQLGANNAIKGLRVKIKPTEELSITALSGYQRVGFGTSNGQMNGINSELNVGDLLNSSDLGIRLGGSYVSRYLSDAITSTINAYSGRLNGDYVGFNFGTEYVIKDPDFSYRDDKQNDHRNTGSAILATLGYSQRGFAISAQYRRLQNMGFYSDPAHSVVTNVFNDQVLNYLPSLTKQHDHNVASLYRYGAQAKVIDNPAIQTPIFGENGGQVDMFFNLPKGSFLGGEFGTKVALNYAVWYNLGGTIDPDTRDYKITEEFGDKLFQDASVEVKKKWNEKWSSVFSYINTFYNTAALGSPTGQAHVPGIGKINADMLIVEATHKWYGAKASRVILEHLDTADDLKNWGSMTLEHNFNSHYSMYALDLYNYGNPDADQRIHYYNVGASYSQGPTRFTVSYGRQRGGLFCSGGVCRIIQPNTGLNFTLSTTF